MYYKRILLIFMVIGFTKLNAQNNSEKNLFGTWSASASKTTIQKNGTSTIEKITCNVCPKVVFTFERKIRNASVIKPNGNKENYIWSIKDNTIVLYNIDAKANLNPFFVSGTKYKLKYLRKNGTNELELVNQNTKSSIILNK